MAFRQSENAGEPSLAFAFPPQPPLTEPYVRFSRIRLSDMAMESPPVSSHPLSVRGGQLGIDAGGGPMPLTGLDYLVVRIECRRERDDWRLPELDALIRLAGDAQIRGQNDAFVDRRREAIAGRGTLRTPSIRA